MYQNTCVGFKLGFQNRFSNDAKLDAIAFCVKTYSSLFIKNRTNMHEMQNQMKIPFCVKPPLPSILLADKGAPREVFGGGLSWPNAGTGPTIFIFDVEEKRMVCS